MQPDKAKVKYQFTILINRCNALAPSAPERVASRGIQRRGARFLRVGALQQSLVGSIVPAQTQPAGREPQRPSETVMRTPRAACLQCHARHSGKWEPEGRNSLCIRNCATSGFTSARLIGPRPVLIQSKVQATPAERSRPPRPVKCAFYAMH
jgi:hypothetical protein